MFASIEDSDSDLDNNGDDSSSNTSADDHMTTKRQQCRLQGAGVKEVRALDLFAGANYSWITFLDIILSIIF